MKHGHTRKRDSSLKMIDDFMALKKNRYTYNTTQKHLSSTDYQIVEKFLDAWNRKRDRFEESKKRIREKTIRIYENDFIFKLDKLFRIFHNLNIEQREASKLSNGADRLAELVDLKRYLYSQMIEILEGLAIKKENRDELEYILRTMLNDNTFRLIYLGDDADAKKIINNIIETLDGFQRETDTLSDYEYDDEDIDYDSFEEFQIRGYEFD